MSEPKSTTFRETALIDRAIRDAHSTVTDAFVRLQRMNIPERDRLLLHKVADIAAELRSAMQIASDLRLLERALRRAEGE
jgi:hypothetical protein